MSGENEKRCPISSNSSNTKRSMPSPLSVTMLHPAGGPYAVQAARAFAEAGLLRRFITTLVDRPNSFLQRSLCNLAGAIGFDLARQVRRRAVVGIDPDRVVSYPWREAARLAVGRLDRSRVWVDRTWEWAEKGFDRWVATNGLRHATAVYGYEHACQYSLEAGRDRGLFRIYDVPAPEHEFTHRILCREADQLPELSGSYEQHVRRPEIHQRRTERRRREWLAADIVIANSNFTRNSFAGYEDSSNPNKGLSKVFVVPYGAPPPDPLGVQGGSHGQGPLRVLWAGTLSVRKGFHYLIDAWKLLADANRHIEITLYGANSLPESLTSRIPSEFRLRGSVPREELDAAYRAADVFVFPTLCDGFGMVATEAFSHGLPVITTPAAGAADLVQQGINGLLVPPRDPQRLAEALQWCLDHRSDLREMRVEALKTAVSWQWADYRRACAKSSWNTIYRPT